MIEPRRSRADRLPLRINEETLTLRQGLEVTTKGAVEQGGGDGVILIGPRMDLQPEAFVPRPVPLEGEALREGILGNALQVLTNHADRNIIFLHARSITLELSRPARAAFNLNARKEHESRAIAGSARLVRLRCYSRARSEV